MSGRLSRLLRSVFVPGSLRARSMDRWCDVDAFPGGAYNHQLMRSRAAGDLVRYPDFLWSPTPYWTARSGLDAHFRELAERLDGAVYSDVLVVLNRDDHARTRESWLESWDRAARSELAECWTRIIDSEGWALAMPGRDFHLEVLCDGDPRVGFLGLDPGEFVTGMLPNLYLGPDSGSAPLVEVFARTADAAFRSLGTMYTDQLAFSVGAHGLDNGRVDSLGDSAVYTVHRFPGEPGLHHKLQGGRSERWEMERGEAHGGETIRVVDRGRSKLMIEVMLVSAKHPAAEFERSGGVEHSVSELPAMGLFGPAAPSTILPEGVDLGTLGAMSIIPDAMPQPSYTLTRQAVLLQRVHFRQVMSGYRMAIERSGRITPRGTQPVAELEVIDDRPSIAALARDVSVDGRPLRVGDRVALQGPEHTVRWRGGSILYRSMRRPSDPKWPYLARLESPRGDTPLFDGGTYVLGRDRDVCDIALPDRSTAENIVWRDGCTSGPVEVRGGRVDRASFRTDAIGVATRAGSLDLTGDLPRVTNLSGSCPMHILRGDGAAVRLKEGASATLEPGDELLVGNQVFALMPSTAARRRREGTTGVLRKTQIGPMQSGESQRHEGGPGSKGRRPLVGGARGVLVESENTYASVLGMSPAGDRAVSPASNDATVLDEAECLPSVQLQSLSLDPSDVQAAVDVVGALEPGPTRADDWVAPVFDAADLFDGMPTIVDEPEALDRPTSLPPARSAADLPPGPPPMKEPAPRRCRPRGLQVGIAEPLGGFGTLRRRSGALPGLGHLVPLRPEPPAGTQGD